MVTRHRVPALESRRPAPRPPTRPTPALGALEGRTPASPAFTPPSEKPLRAHANGLSGAPGACPSQMPGAPKSTEPPRQLAKAPHTSPPCTKAGRGGSHARLPPGIARLQCRAGDTPGGGPGLAHSPERHGRGDRAARRHQTRTHLHAGDDAQEPEDDEHVEQPSHVPQRQQAQHLQLPGETHGARREARGRVFRQRPAQGAAGRALRLGSSTGSGRPTPAGPAPTPPPGRRAPISHRSCSGAGAPPLRSQAERKRAGPPRARPVPTQRPSCSNPSSDPVSQPQACPHAALSCDAGLYPDPLSVPGDKRARFY